MNDNVKIGKETQIEELIQLIEHKNGHTRSNNCWEFKHQTEKCGKRYCC